MATLQRLPLPRMPFSFAPGFSSIYQFIETCSKQLRSEMTEIEGIASKMTENTLNCWFCNVFGFPTQLYDHSLTHAHNHITPAVAAMDSCFALG